MSAARKAAEAAAIASRVLQKVPGTATLHLTSAGSAVSLGEGIAYAHNAAYQNERVARIRTGPHARPLPSNVKGLRLRYSKFERGFVVKTFEQDVVPSLVYANPGLKIEVEGKGSLSRKARSEQAQATVSKPTTSDEASTSSGERVSEPTTSDEASTSSGESLDSAEEVDSKVAAEKRPVGLTIQFDDNEEIDVPMPGLSPEAATARFWETLENPSMLKKLRAGENPGWPAPPESDPYSEMRQRAEDAIDKSKKMKRRLMREQRLVIDWKRRLQEEKTAASVTRDALNFS